MHHVMYLLHGHIHGWMYICVSTQVFSPFIKCQIDQVPNKYILATGD